MDPEAPGTNVATSKTAGRSVVADGEGASSLRRVLAAAAVTSNSGESGERSRVQLGEEGG